MCDSPECKDLQEWDRLAMHVASLVGPFLGYTDSPDPEVKMRHRRAVRNTAINMRVKASQLLKKSSVKVITLCGSTRFKQEFYEVQKRLTLAGNIVISVGLFGHSGDDITEQEKEMLDDLHKRKIDMSDEIFVINVGGYIGESTKDEIKYAKRHGKVVNYLEL